MMKNPLQSTAAISSVSGYVGLFILLAGSLGSGARELAATSSAFDAQHREAVSKNPQGLSFTIYLKDGKRQFYQGEIIRIKLSFASSLPDTYRLDLRKYDRSGRMHYEAFHVDQADSVVDPLWDYFHSGLFGFLGGGLSSVSPVLDEKPETVTLEMNEWV